ncbi:MAG TPA: geranylgeranyl reductase family protein [Gemmatimonadales bacterium]|nr:geranylgeranyl reductase family protein [Gemmatimonadales bacterium]
MAANLTSAIFDVAVVGSGPAGATAARTLAERGLKVVLLERETLPRYKTCGGGLVDRAFELLPKEVTGVIERNYNVAELHLLDRDLHFRAERRTRVVGMTMRDRLDQTLATAAVAAGAELRAPCRVTGMNAERDGVRLDTDRAPVRARFVIGADGANSDVARFAGWNDGRLLIPALEYELRVDDATLDRFASAPRFDVGPVPYGYAWVFPKATHLSVGVLTGHRGAINLHQHVEAYLRAIGLVARSVERHGFVIPIRPRAGPLARGRVLLTGDAAGLADPLTAEGISPAARSGRLAARAIHEGWETGSDPARVSETYAMLLRPMLADLRVGRWLARLLYDHPRARAWIFRRMGQRLVEAITDVFLGVRTYRGSLTGLALALARRASTRS